MDALISFCRGVWQLNLQVLPSQGGKILTHQAAKRRVQNPSPATKETRYTYWRIESLLVDKFILLVFTKSLDSGR